MKTPSTKKVTLTTNRPDTKPGPDQALISRGATSPFWVAIIAIDKPASLPGAPTPICFYPESPHHGPPKSSSIWAFSALA